MLEIHQIRALSDNYIYIVIDRETNVSAVVDPGEAKPVIKFCDVQNIHPKFILNTHHHWDHTNGNAELVKRYGCRIIAPKNEARIEGVDIAVGEGDLIKIGAAQAKIIETPAHTKSHICFYFQHDAALFCGDTLFSIGCGRLFEGDAQDMFSAMQKLKRLPDDVRVYCGHEYTQSNIAFAQTVLPENQDLHDYSEKVDKLRAEGKPSVPSEMKIEKAANPFMLAETAEQLGEYRTLKDNF